MSVVQVSVSPPPRGGKGESATFVAQSFRGSFSWGTQPGTAVITYVPATAGVYEIQTGAFVAVKIGGHYFTGVCKEDGQNNSAGGGIQRALSFVDMRYFLTFDWVYCAFNMADVRLVNGVRVKRYWSIWPADYDTMRKTYTDAPVPAHRIVGALLAAKTVGSPWKWNRNGNGAFNPPLMNTPIYGFDAMSGKRLDAALGEISERLGLVFTADPKPGSDYRLVWTRKGYGSPPLFPPNSDDRRIGYALSGNASDIRILGERNKYQLLNVPMVKDWLPAWEVFLDVDLLANDLYWNETDPVSGQRFYEITGDTEHWVGFGRAKVWAFEITVRQYAALREARSPGSGALWLDTRKVAGRWRADMPAALYIRQLVFRAFRPVLDGVFTTAGGLMPLDCAPIADQLCCRVTYNPANGAMTAWPAEPADGNGVLLAKGYQVGADLFRLVQPDRISTGLFGASNRLWAQTAFQADDSGEGVRFVIAETPVFTSENLFTTIDGHCVLNAAATISTPAMTAALVFEGDRFSWRKSWQSNGREHVEPVGGIWGEYVGVAGTAAYTEIVYANGETAAQKAEVLADNLLLRQRVYASGGYTLKWNPSQPLAGFGVGLSSVIDRTDITIGPGGVQEVVDFTNERSKNNFEPEREYDRRTMATALFPGQAELRVEAADQRRLMAGMRAMGGNERDMFSRFLRGEAVENLYPVRFVTTGLTLPAGTPVRKKPAPATLCEDPSAVSEGADEFAGVTVRHSESTSGEVRLATKGQCLARVKGPVAMNGSVGLSATESVTHLVAGGTPPVGIALQAIEDDSVVLIRVMLGSGGGTGGGYEGDYDHEKDYGKGSITRSLNSTPAGVFGALKPVPAGEVGGTQSPGVGADAQGDTEYWHFLTGTYGIEEYNALLTYGEGRMVRVSSGDSQGTWMVAKGKTAAAGTAPQWPEPADPTWMLVAFGVRAIEDCPDSETTIYINGTPVNDDPPT